MGPQRNNVIHRNLTRDNGLQVGVISLERAPLEHDLVGLFVVPKQSARAAIIIGTVADYCADGVLGNSELEHQGHCRSAKIVRARDRNRQTGSS